jgi:serine O-acetyltransferase
MSNAASQLLLESVLKRLNEEASVGLVMGLQAKDITCLPKLFGLLLASVAHQNDQVAKVSEAVFTNHPNLVETSVREISETARRNYEPGGMADALLFSRGVQAILAHRVAHQLWQEGKQSLALAIKSTLGRALGTDIHPAAKMGSGIWLDHGLGFVVGEMAVIEDNVSIWHNVTLGSTLSDSGSARHPTIKRGAVLGAGCFVLGGISVGENAAVAAGAIVLESVPAKQVVAGQKASLKGATKVSFLPAAKA